MKRKHAEKGQAITELLAGLVGIVMIFIGLLLVSALSMENVRCLIEARGSAEVAAAEGEMTGGKSPETIIEWNSGEDGIPFTADDTPVTGATQEKTLEEFNTGGSSTWADDRGTSNAATGVFINALTAGQLQSGNYISDCLDAAGFLECANLRSSTHKTEDPIAKRGLPDLGKSVQLFFGTKQMTLEDTVYLPVRTNDDKAKY